MQREKRTNKTTLSSEWRSALKKSLTESALLEMSGYATYQDLSANRTRIAYHFTSSISLGRQVLFNHGSSGPYMRRITNQLLPGTVCSQLFSLPAGGFGAK